LNIELGQLFVKLGMDASGLKEGAGDAGRALGELDWTLKGVIKTISGLAVAAAGPAALLAMTQRSLETIDAQSKLAYRLGGTVTAIQGLAYAADLANISQEGLAKSVGVLDQRLAQAATQGHGKAAEALKNLHLNAQELLKLDVDERLAKIADQMKALGYTTAQQADVLKSFGIRQQNILLLFEGGGDKIRNATKEVVAFGIAVSNVDAIRIEQANNAWKEARLVLTAIGNHLAVELADIIGFVGKKFAQAGKDAGGFGNLIQQAVRQGVEAIASLADIVTEAFYSIAQKMGEASELKKNLDKIGHYVDHPLDLIRDAINNVGETVDRFKDDVVKPPANTYREAWLKIYDDQVKMAREAAEKIAADRKEIQDKPGAKIDPLTAEQRKALDERLDNLKKALANESLALQIEGDKQIKEANFLSKKLGLSQEQRNTLLKNIDEKYQKDRQELVQSMLEQTILKQDEILKRDYDKKLRDLQKFENDETITKAKAEEIRQKLTDKYRIDALQAAAQQYSQLANIVDTSLGQIKQLMSDKGGAAFEIMKALSIATATVKGFEAVVGAYAAGNNIGGPVVGAVFAAIAAAGVAAQIANIARTKPGSAASSTASAPSAGSAAAATAGASAPQSSQTIYLRGLNPDHLFSGAAIRQLAEGLRDYQRNGGKLVIE
jgi:hypothetical protein